MLHKFKNKWYALSLRNKILSLLFSSVVFSLAIALLCIHLISNAYSKVLFRSFSENLSQASANLSARVEDVETVSNLILADRTVQQKLAILMDSVSPSEIEAQKTILYSALNDYPVSFPHSCIRYMAVLQSERLFSTSISDTAQLPDNLLEHLSCDAMDGEARNIWCTEYSDEYGLFLVRNLRESANLSLRSLGILIINVDLEALTRQAALAENQDSVSYIILNDGACFYHSTSLTNIEADALAAKFSGEYQSVSIGGQKYFLSGSYSKHPGWTFLCAVPYSILAGTITATRVLCVLAIVLGMLILFIITGRLTGLITAQFQVLTEKMHRVGEGKFFSAPPSGNESFPFDDIAMLNESFDAMTQKIDTLIQENYVNELLKKEAQIKALENQMNPHFLYNTLDAINWRAKAAGEDEISQIALALGRLLRAALAESDAPHTLADEIAILDNYLLIQKLRYKDRLVYTCSIPDVLKDCEIPKFTLQPLMENAIRYGLEACSEPCSITLSAVQQGETLVVEVCNSGSAFPDQLLERLESKEVTPNGFGVGLMNIQHRLRLTYGAAYGLQLINFEDDDGEEYAIARILLPYHTEESSC